MKKFLCLAALFAFGLVGISQAADKASGAYNLPLVGEYVNDAGMVVIAPAAKSQNANYDVLIQDNSGKCSLQIVAGTWQTTEQQGAIGPKTHPNAIVTVESKDYPNFALWPEDQTIRLADDALPFDKLDPACQAFKGNMTFTRKQ